MSDPFRVVRDFEAALCEYTGAPYCVTTTSCTFALLLATAYHVRRSYGWSRAWRDFIVNGTTRPLIDIPKRTYVGVPMAIVHAGGWPTFRDENWDGMYQIKPFPIWDSARWFTRDLFTRKRMEVWDSLPMRQNGRWHAMPSLGMVCISFHWTKTLGIQQGGAILHDNQEADKWLRKARFDGRTEGVAPTSDVFDTLGWHAYMAPETAAAGLVRLASLPRHNEPIPHDEYPDLSELEIFK